MAYGHKPCSLSTKYVIQSLRQSRYSGINTNTGCMESMGIQNMQSMRMPALVGCRKYSVDVLFKHSCCSPQAGTAVGCPIHCKQLQLITLILTVSMNGSSPERWSEASIKSLNPSSAECPFAPADPQWLGLAGWGWYMARADKILIHKLMMPPPTTVLIPSPSLSFSPSLPLSSLWSLYWGGAAAVLVSSYTAGKHCHPLLCYVDTYHSHCQSAGQLSIDWKVFCSF